MNLMDRLSNYIYDKEMSIHIYSNRINIVNYNEISHFSTTKIIVTYNDGTIIIIGKNLVVSKLLDNEILISGEMKHIELG